jgi:hypothetical protein
MCTAIAAQLHSKQDYISPEAFEAKKIACGVPVKYGQDHC